MYPIIICHIMGSVDGRLLTERWTEPFGGKSKGELMRIYSAIGSKLDIDAWMFGKTTLCEAYFPKKYHVKDTTPLEHAQFYVARRTSDRLFVVADPDADILYESSSVRGDSIVAILPEKAPAIYLEYLQKKDISYVFAGEKGDDLRVAMQTLAEEFGQRVFFTPKKMGAQTAEANINAGLAAARQIAGFFKDGCEKFRVNK